MNRLVKDKNTKRAFQHFLKEHPEYRFGQALTIFLNDVYQGDINYVYIANSPQDDNSELKDVFILNLIRTTGNGLSLL